MPVTRTLGPLHFEDLEPKRFEDLVRQLIYDFKRWRRLEATGRSGTDDGFDARGYEIFGALIAEPDGQDSNENLYGESDRLWLVQCKREKTISPSKLSAYLKDIRISEEEQLHGIVFVAACDFSKRARDEFRTQCEALGIQEWHLWGKAELEDLLFQPRNDHLLFAYFGVSLAIRRRGQQTELRQRLATKRKAHRLLEPFIGNNVLLRNPGAVEYPYSEEITNFAKHPQWFVVNYKGMDHSGLLFTVAKHFAYLDDARSAWDAAFVLNDALTEPDPWRDESPNWDLRNAVYSFWQSLPKQNQAWLEIDACVPFSSIMDIDELGDDRFEGPHLYVPFHESEGPFSGFMATVESAMTCYP